MSDAKKDRVLNFIFHSKPKVYGWIYLTLIPVFGVVFYFILETDRGGLTIWESFYFSAVTITTLGYGDITPINDCGRAVAAVESVLGITVIGLFLNALSRVRDETSRHEEVIKQKKAYREGEIAKLSGFYNLIKPLIGKYRTSVVQVTSPLKSRGRNYNPEFTLNDLKDLFRPSLLLTHNQFEPAIKHYFKSQEMLNRELMDLIKNIDMSLFPELEEQCLSFVETVHSFDFSSAILGVINAYMGEGDEKKKMTDFIAESLDSYEGPVKFKDSNMLNAYVALYYQIKSQMQSLGEIDAEFSRILNSK